MNLAGALGILGLYSEKVFPASYTGSTSSWQLESSRLQSVKEGWARLWGVAERRIVAERGMIGGVCLPQLQLPRSTRSQPPVTLGSFLTQCAHEAQWRMQTFHVDSRQAQLDRILVDRLTSNTGIGMRQFWQQPTSACRILESGANITA